ncbi:hypothetical protein LCGC14_2339920, partial [marine sediment metagenome]
DDDGVDDDFEEENKRDIEIEIGEDEFQIESDLRHGDVKDSIRLKVTYDEGGVGVKITYKEELESAGVNESQSGFELEFKVEFREIIEFLDLNGNGMYDKSTDQLVQEYDLNSFQDIVYTTSSISNDTTLHYLIINTTDGVFALHIFFVEEFVIVNGTFVAPTQSKIDIEISNFNYLNESSQLALYIKLESGGEYKEDDETDDEEDGNATEEDGVVVESNGLSGIFTWKETALIDGVVKNVSSNALEVDDEDELEQKLILSYPRGNHIYHDPKVGITIGGASTSSIPFGLTGVIVSVVVVVSVAVVLIKKRKIA